MLLWSAASFFFFLGLVVGSHLNVLILRFGFEEHANPRSECAHCGTALRWFDLIPIVSYALLRGRCRSCGSAFSPQYPLVEGMTGLLFALSYVFYAPHLGLLSIVGFLSLLVFLSASMVVVVYDFRHTLVPLSFVYAAASAAGIRRISDALLSGSTQPLIDGALGAFLLFAFFAAISLLTRGRGMGFGDAYVAGSVGLLLGVVGGLNAATLGVWSATVVYLAILAASRIRLLRGHSRVTMKTELPFAPWLLIGALLVLFTDLSPFGAGQWLSRFFV